MPQDKAEPLSISTHMLPWQHEMVAQILQLRQQQTLPHALLIEMQTGVDSRSFGGYLAKSLLCDDHTEKKPCGNCEHCHLMEANNYPDFTFTTLMPNERTGKLNKDIKIGQIRQLIHQLTLTANKSAGKCALIYPAEKMNQSAANGLLKTLEEPAKEVTLILLTHHANRLPITVRSRCQQWRLRNPAEDIARDWLHQNGLDQEQIQDGLSLTKGDPQMALQLYQQDTLGHVKKFAEGLQRFIQDKDSVTSVISLLKQLSSETVRLIIRNTLHRYIYDVLEKECNQRNKDTMVGLLELAQHASSVLLNEENNLNLQLQLEDVLISFKQILKREAHHAFT